MGLFKIAGGRVKCFKWSTDTTEPEGCWLGPGDFLSVPAGTPHAIYADPTLGVQFHEIVGEFKKRSTHFYNTDTPDKESKSGCVLCADGKLRFQPPALRSRFLSARVFITGCSR